MHIGLYGLGKTYSDVFQCAHVGSVEPGEIETPVIAKSFSFYSNEIGCTCTHVHDFIQFVKMLWKVV